MALPEKSPSSTIEKQKESLATSGSSAQARLRALDGMLGGVAHDLNNALSVVLMNLDVMQQDAAVMSKHGRRIDGMLDAMTGASALVRHLLNFSHSRRPEPEIISITEILPPLVEFIQVAIGREIEALIDADEAGPCCVMADAASFEVAVAHIALQLAKAMKGGGVMTFHLAKADAADAEVVLTLEGEPRDKPSSANGGALDLDLVEHFARDAQGRMTSETSSPNLYRVAIRLPRSAETTTD